MDVTVSNFPTQISVTSTPINVTASEVGVSGPIGGIGATGPQGPAGTGSSTSNSITGISISGGLGFTGNFNILAGSNVTLTQNGSNTLSISATAGASNLNGLISTGDADNRYLFTGSSGYFYPWSNPNNFLRSGEATSANISGLATSGNLETTGTSLQNQINIIKDSTGVFIQTSNLIGLISTGSADLRYIQTGASGELIKLTNLNGLISSGGVDTKLIGLITTGQGDLRWLNTGSSGQFYPASNLSNFSSSGNVENTGTNLQNQIFSIKNGTGVFLQNSNLNGLISTGSADLRYLNTGVSGEFYKVSNPNNFIRSGDFSLAGLISTGSADLRYLQTGVSGEFYKASNPAGYITTANLNGLITTGSTDIRYLQTGVSGEFLKNQNLVGLASTGYVNSVSGSLQQNLEFSGGYLFGLINASSAGVSSVNSASGALTINGAGNVSVVTAGQTITVSGNTGFLQDYYKTYNPLNFSSSGNVELSGTNLQNQLNNITQGTGNFYLTSNPNNFSHSGFITTTSGSLSERIVLTGSNLQSQINILNSLPKVTGILLSDSEMSLTGQILITGIGNVSVTNSGNIVFVSGSTGFLVGYYSTSNPSNYITSTNLNGLISTGDSELRYLSSGASGAFYASSNPSNYITVLNLEGLITTGSADIRYLQTGVSGEFIKNSNLIGLISSGGVDIKLNGLANSGNFVSGISVTGGVSIQNSVNLLQGSNITLSQAGNSITISSVGGGSSTNGVTGLSITGGVAISGAISLTGIDGLRIVQLGNTLQFSGSQGGVTNNITNNYSINSGSGIFIYRSGISSGVTQQFISFPATLDAKPIVLASLHNDDFYVLLNYQISGAVTTGFWVLLSDVVPNTGYYLDILASNSQQTGMATNVIVNNTNTISTWSKLTWDTTTIWNVQTNVLEDRKILITTGDTTVKITGLYNGWAGVLKFVQSGISSSGYALGITGFSTNVIKTRVVDSGNAGNINVTRISGSVDVLGFEYDGLDLLTTFGNNFI